MFIGKRCDSIYDRMIRVMSDNNFKSRNKDSWANFVIEMTCMKAKSIIFSADKYITLSPISLSLKREPPAKKKGGE